VDRERVAYVALALTPGIGPARLRALVAACGSACAALSAPSGFLRQVAGISVAASGAIEGRSLDDGERALAELERLGGRALLPDDEDFPAPLRGIPEPPVLLFALGDLSLAVGPLVAIVGSRDHSAYGAAACRLIATVAARFGIVVVSGMARGLDAVAHRAALEAGGTTVGVLGNGLGVVYPAANRALYDAVAGRGLLLTEFPPGERPHAGSFPQRNRLISGLARVTVVVEAAAGSGALITAEAALEQGREVLAVPGPMTSRTSVGANRLIRDGATPLLEPADLFHHYPELAGPALGADWDGMATQRARSELGADTMALADAIGFDPIHVDTLAERLGRSAGDLLSALCALELAGVVQQQAGGLFRRT
jgi:DNA processing protein